MTLPSLTSPQLRLAAVCFGHVPQDVLVCGFDSAVADKIGLLRVQMGWNQILKHHFPRYVMNVAVLEAVPVRWRCFPLRFCSETERRSREQNVRLVGAGTEFGLEGSGAGHFFSGQAGNGQFRVRQGRKPEPPLLPPHLLHPAQSQCVSRHEHRLSSESGLPPDGCFLFLLPVLFHGNGAGGVGSAAPLPFQGKESTHCCPATQSDHQPDDL